MSLCRATNAKGGEACELYCQLTEARERLAAAERVIAAGMILADESMQPHDFRLALCDYQALKQPDKEE